MTIRNQLISAFISIWLGSSTHAAGAMRSLEDAQETSSDTVVLPGSDAGSFYFKNCPACNQSPIRLSPASKLFIGEQQVTMAQLKIALAAKEERFMTIFYTPTDRVVTRVVMMPPTVSAPLRGK